MFFLLKEKCVLCYKHVEKEVIENQRRFKVVKISFTLLRCLYPTPMAFIGFVAKKCELFQSSLLFSLRLLTRFISTTEMFCFEPLKVTSSRLISK